MRALPVVALCLSLSACGGGPASSAPDAPAASAPAAGLERAALVLDRTP